MKKILTGLSILLFLLLSPALFAETFEAGKDYELIKNTTATSAKGKAIAVTEFFSYGCPWCYRVDAGLNKWIAAQHNRIHFNRVPVVFNNDWLFYAKAYYTINALGLDTKLNTILFSSVQSKTPPLNSNEAMMAFLVKQGLDKAVVESAFKNSTTIDMQINQGAAAMAGYHITAVPAFVINNQYKTDLQMAKTEERLFQIMDYLVEQAQKNS